MKYDSRMNRFVELEQQDICSVILDNGEKSGGVLIGPNIILTSAHQFHPKNWEK